MSCWVLFYHIFNIVRPSCFLKCKHGKQSHTTGQGKMFAEKKIHVFSCLAPTAMHVFMCLPPVACLARLHVFMHQGPVPCMLLVPVLNSSKCYLCWLARFTCFYAFGNSCMFPHLAKLCIFMHQVPVACISFQCWLVPSAIYFVG